MKKGLLIMMMALLTGLVSFNAGRCRKEAVHRHAPGGAVVLDAMPELDWLKAELGLTEEQYAKVSELHAIYRPRCAEMCRRIMEAHEKVAALAAANHSLTPEYRAALREHTQVHVECQEEMLTHLYRTAALLREDQAGLYLKTMLPFALDFSHSGPGDLHGR